MSLEQFKVIQNDLWFIFRQNHQFKIVGQDIEYLWMVKQVFHELPEQGDISLGYI